jgi:hypothetical protein
MRIARTFAVTALAAALASAGLGGVASADSGSAARTPTLHVSMVVNGVVQPMLSSYCKVSLSNGDHTGSLFCSGPTKNYGQDYYLGITGYNADGSYVFTGTTGLIGETVSIVNAGSNWWLDSSTAWAG